ncbi:hypothetical protein [Delftia tsuruhatensis]|uniref:hypothetical protein n=1 Tax=Delftia tsuruhatensis TaxID=180282 RepID=UPI001F1AFB9C|nr:hypothetical protein [Delftia tsuruhatensis]
MANVAGLYLLGSLDAWRRWLQAASHYLLVWRLCLYAMAGYGWWRMRRQLLAREPGADAGRRLLRAEIGALVAIAALEISLLRQAM